MKLLASQKDTLYDLIGKFDLSPSQFELTESLSRGSSDDRATVLQYKNSDFYFSFETGRLMSSPHASIICPGTNEYQEHHFPGTWDKQLQIVARWLTNLVREINSPNKWDRLAKEMEGIKVQFTNDDEDKFSVQEYEILQIKISSLKEGLNSIDLPANQLAALHAKLDHLSDLGKVLNKFDWKGLFIGTIISIIIQLEVNQANANLLWTMIKKIFSNYLLP